MYRIWQELTFCLDDVILWHQFGWSWGHEQFLEGCLREVLLTEHDNLYRHDYRDRMVVFFSEGDHPGDHRMVRFLHSSLHILCFDICIDKKTSKWQDSTLCFFGGAFLCEMVSCVEPTQFLAEHIRCNAKFRDMPTSSNIHPEDYFFSIEFTDRHLSKVLQTCLTFAHNLRRPLKWISYSCGDACKIIQVTFRAAIGSPCIKEISSSVALWPYFAYFRANQTTSDTALLHDSLVDGTITLW